MKFNGETLRKELLNAKRKKKITQTMIAKKLGIDKSAISNAIKHNGMTEDRLKWICDYIGVDISVITDMSDMETVNGDAAEVIRLKTELDKANGQIQSLERENSKLKSDIISLYKRLTDDLTKT